MAQGDDKIEFRPSTVLRRNQRVEYRSLGDEESGVLLHLDTAAYHGLNPVGALTWSLLEDGITFEALLDRLRRELDETPDTFQEEIAEFLGQLAERDLIYHEEGSGSG
jgi:hypothetical protein